VPWQQAESACISKEEKHPWLIRQGIFRQVPMAANLHQKLIKSKFNQRLYSHKIITR
jgi:hypothetical protein